jgi:Rieske Fe-S protein
VIADGGEITARDVIVAAHVPVTNRFLVHTKLAAYRTYVVAFTAPGEGQAPVGLFWDTAHPYHYIRSQRLDGASYVVVGGEDHKVGEKDDTTAPFRALEKYVESHFGWPVAATDYRWSGQIIEPADGLPYVGRNSLSSHVYVATGYAGNGMTNGTLAAMLLTDEIRGVQTPYAALFDATRFKPLASVRAYLSENVDYPKHLVTDRLPQIARRAGLDDIPPGEGRVLTLGGKKLAVYRNERGGLQALSPVCTHLGCIVQWNTTEKSWDCPCHGSRFDPQGIILNGPAVTPLEARPIPSDDDEATIPDFAPEAPDVTPG